MRFLLWLPMFAFAASGFANPAQPQQSEEDAHTTVSGANASPTRSVSAIARNIKQGRSHQENVFADRVQKYVEMQKNLERSGSPAAGNSTDSEEIADRQHALAGRIAAERHGSRQGDIFTHEVAEQFVKIIRKAFKEPGGRAMRRTIQEDGAVKPTVLHVNDVYPEGISRTTMPPTLLRRLPALPMELAYRIIGRALVLQDIKTNLIVDFISNAIP